MMSDPIADMFTRIRNAGTARKATVEMPWSRHKEAIARVLQGEGYLESVSVERDGHPVLRLELRYDARRRHVINGLERVSRPSLRVYVGAQDIPAVRRGLGVNVLSTSRGVLPDREARKQGVGGEIICRVW
ncbi:MAG TPA: 30S ribosomal protein S8 [Candidatus Limnocylindria bacterium]|nr:30S ribosomal protein S8 [Candidatus Limnocylindria bacterium]